MKFEKRRVKKPPTKGYSKKYPMFAFRIPQSDGAGATLKNIHKNLETLYDSMRERAKGDERIINRNDILLEALDRGLIELKGEYN